MIPIYEQGEGEGIGHSFMSFREKFIEICDSHKQEDRALAFAFILYDFKDESIRKVLKDLGGFARLDRLAGRDLSIFYLHSDKKTLTNKFNKEFLSEFTDEDVEFPCVVFFKLNDDKIEDILISELEREELAYSFDELYNTIEKYITTLKDNSETTSFQGKLNSVYIKTKSVGYNKIIELLIDNIFGVIFRF